MTLELSKVVGEVDKMGRTLAERAARQREVVQVSLK